MEPTDLTIAILESIRDEGRKTNQQLEATNQQLEATNQRLERLERRQAETEVRLATELVAVVGAVHELRDVLREDRRLRDRVDDHERRLSAVERKAG